MVETKWIMVAGPDGESEWDIDDWREPNRVVYVVHFNGATRPSETHADAWSDAYADVGARFEGDTVTVEENDAHELENLLDRDPTVGGWTR